MRDVFKLGLFLLTICVIVAFGTSYVYALAEPIILEKEKETQEQGLKDVFIEADKTEDESSQYLKDIDNSVIKEVYIASKEDQQIGTIYLVEPMGYNGEISLLVGFDLESKEVTNIKVLSHEETPGLGDAVEESWFADRFTAKSAEEDLEVVTNPASADNEIEAITASTITSDAVVRGVNEARMHFQENFINS